MARMQELRRTINAITNHRGPVFSAYLSTNAAIPENQGQAYLVRLKEALKELGVPEEVAARVRESVEEEAHPRARTVALFAAEDGFIERCDLQVDLPEAFRWGEPNVAQLMLAVDEHEPYGVVLVDAEEFRFFVTSPVHETPENGFGSGFYREVELSPSQPYPRGGTDYEPASRRTEANVHKFYNELADLTRRLAFREGVRRLILGGPKERTSEFREQLPKEVRELVVAEEHVPLGAPEGEIEERLEEIRERAEREREAGILAGIRESGVRGPDETIAALQEENRVYHLMALWELEGEIRWCDNDRLAIRDITRKECPFCGQETRVRPIKDVLIDLTAARGARLDFVRGEHENTDTLRDEFGGLAGLTRF